MESRYDWLKRGPSTAQGRVVEIVNYNNLWAYRVIVEFKTPDGQAHRFYRQFLVQKKGTFNTMPGNYAPPVGLGDPLEVLYDPNNPSKAIVNLPFDISNIQQAPTMLKWFGWGFLLFFLLEIGMALLGVLLIGWQTMLQLIQ